MQYQQQQQWVQQQRQLRRAIQQCPHVPHVGQHLAIRTEMRLSRSDSYTLLFFLFFWSYSKLG